ncbi:MAG: MBL fold metallo-hydrolase RNA specificity domain-containing protein, partial [Bacillota bacterium]
FSAHADQKDLFKYISNLNNLKKIFLTHGEKETKEIFKNELEKNNFNVYIPEKNEIVEI